MMPIDPVSESKEYFWCAKLDKKENSFQWAGRDDGAMEQVVLKRACLGPKVKENERNIVEVTSFDHKQDKVSACVCSLKINSNEDVSLGDLTIFPPAIFKLIEGSGPVHLVGSHMMLEEEDDDDSSDDDYNASLEDLDESAEQAEESAISKEKQSAAAKSAEAKAKKETQSPKKAKKIKEEVPEVDKDVEDDDDNEEEDELDMEEFDDDDDDMEGDEEDDDEEEEEEEEVPKVQPAGKKRKLSNGNTKENQKKTPEVFTPSKKVKTEQPATPKTPKTPLQQKENKSPKSGSKKTPAKTYDTVDEVKAAIKKFPGGKPRKEDKFSNWVKSAFKVKDEEWIKELWKAHKKDLGL